MRNLLYLVLIGLVVYTIVDVVRSEDRERAGMPKALWIVLIVVFPLIGSIAWLAVSRAMRSRGAGVSRGGGWGSAPTTPAGPVAPDDDPEFLWLLEQHRRQAEREGRRSAPTDGATPSGGPDPAGGPSSADGAGGGVGHGDESSGHDHPDPRTQA
ncbi:PLD nuclease N-terminal domain-containing protein [Cellulomonas fimi]|uniref:PLDc_N domain-containing protein n=1 Tax=Cellulomonas fimi TaxID=1708 RepID=A0A7Y0LVL7_CELFI|nr:PLD nuclease N-terminal domain-containing protein [Cellulomonas fimi]NMR18785.1 PLDc_N domain-containing protein [Cellulomonas fimi]